MKIKLLSYRSIHSDMLLFVGVFSVLYFLMPNESFWAFISQGFATAVFGFILYRIQKYRNTKLEKLEILYSLLGELQAIKALIDSRKEASEKEIREYGGNILKYNFSYLPISFNYFTIYDNASHKLGVLNNEHLTKKIISCYAETKGFFENLIDLEYKTKEYISKDIEVFLSPNIAQEKKIKILQYMVDTHKNYVSQILNEQLPGVNRHIVDTIDKIKEEITIYK